MSDTSQIGAPLPPFPHDEAADASSLRTIVMLCYVLFLIACVNGVTAIAGIIIAYVKRHDAMNTIWESHFNNLILVFWVMVAAFFVALISFPVSVLSLGLWVSGDFVWPAFSAFAAPVLFWMFAAPLLLIWFFYRIIRGLIHASENRAY